MKRKLVRLTDGQMDQEGTVLTEGAEGEIDQPGEAEDREKTDLDAEEMIEREDVDEYSAI